MRLASARRTTALDVPGPGGAAEPARCPIDHGLFATAPAAPLPDAAPAGDDGAVCPVAHGGAQRPVHRSRADMFVRRLLRIRDRPPGVTTGSAYRTFQRSMLISAIRCTLTYVVFPFVVPAVGFAAGVGPAVGIAIGTVALTCDVFTIRRFFAVDHKWRWHFSAVALAVICLLLVLLVEDVLHFIG